MKNGFAPFGLAMKEAWSAFWKPAKQFAVVWPEHVPALAPRVAPIAELQMTPAVVALPPTNCAGRFGVAKATPPPPPDWPGPLPALQAFCTALNAPDGRRSKRSKRTSLNTVLS